MVCASSPRRSSAAHGAAIAAMREARAALLILDERRRIVLADDRALHFLADASLHHRAPDEALQHIWTRCDEADGDGWVLVGAMKARVIPLAGTDGQRIALILEPLLTREALEGAAARYRLSPRESDVVRGLLDGASVSEIAGGLGIAESTVGDYLKRLFAKTRVRNRAEMIAKLLGWQTPEQLP